MSNPGRSLGYVQPHAWLEASTLGEGLAASGQEVLASSQAVRAGAGFPRLRPGLLKVEASSLIFLIMLLTVEASSLFFLIMLLTVEASSLFSL